MRAITGLWAVGMLLALCGACARSDTDHGEPAADASTNGGTGGTGASPTDASTADASTADASDSDGSIVDAGHLECRAALPLQCGDRLSHSTITQGQPNLWFGYNPSARAESGPETVYVFRADGQCEVVMRLTDLDTDLDIFVMDECDPITCTELSSTPLDLQTNEGVEFKAEAQRDYVVAIDGYSESSGTYSLSVDCFCGEDELGFSGGEWSLQVDRRWNGDTAGVTPTTSLPEEDYEAVADGPSYTVRVDPNWQMVSVGDEPGRGLLVEITEGKLHYELTSGTFAGGALIVWSGTSGLQAELTLFGSGVPIASSERGPLIPKP